MSDREILERAISKAIDGGWKPLVTYKVIDDFGAWATIIPENGKDWQARIIYWQPLESIIYNHEFAKALWGESLDPFSDEARSINRNYSGGGGGSVRYFKKGSNGDWQYHLSKMVISPDPIKYLGENI